MIYDFTFVVVQTFHRLRPPFSRLRVFTPLSSLRSSFSHRSPFRPDSSDFRSIHSTLHLFSASASLPGNLLCCSSPPSLLLNIHHQAESFCSHSNCFPAIRTCLARLRSGWVWIWTLLLASLDPSLMPLCSLIDYWLYNLLTYKRFRYMKSKSLQFFSTKRRWIRTFLLMLR